jgi:hypothetical protein
MVIQVVVCEGQGGYLSGLHIWAYYFGSNVVENFCPY